MRTEQEIRDKMERKLLNSFRKENQNIAERLQSQALVLSWVLGMGETEFMDYWDALLQNA